MSHRYINSGNQDYIRKGHKLAVVVKDDDDIEQFSYSFFKHLPHTKVYQNTVNDFTSSNSYNNCLFLIMNMTIHKHFFAKTSFAYFDLLINEKLMIDEIEITNFCNLECNYCCQSSLSVNKGFLSPRTLDACLNHLVGGQNLCIHGHGEPLLHKDIVTIVKILSSQNINVEMSTNGILLDEKMIENLLSAKLGHLVLSLHTNESYTAFKRLLDMQRHSKDFIRFHVNSFENEKETKAKLASCGIDWLEAQRSIRFQRIITWGGKAKNCTEPVAADVQNALARCYYRRNNCVYMKWNGTIVPCCLDCNNEDILGHILEFNSLQFDRLQKRNCEFCDF